MRTVYDFTAGLVADGYATIRRWPVWKQGVVLVLLVAVVVIVATVRVPSLATMSAWAAQAGGWFVVVFLGVYVVITQFPIPRTILTLSSGVLFGPWLGIVVALSATTVSAAVSLSVVRYFLGDWMAPRLTHPAVRGINSRLRARGWLAVTSLRMIAGVPFSILNYAAALTSVPLVGFTVATLIGSAPGTIATVFLGNTLTGKADPAIMAVTVALACVGITGLILDKKLPVKD
ncbi:MAG: TVP38/TMEM64 family protein [Corynebacterium sp.]|nr:TVP38/TMEM64 family protein [Corynebacterium sp.]